MLFVDKNGFQAMGTTDDVLALADLSAKFSSFGFETLEVNGHDENAINDAIRQLWAAGQTKPKARIACTVKGKGVSFMESSNLWHYTRLDAQSFAAAVSELGLPGASRSIISTSSLPSRT